MPPVRFWLPALAAAAGVAATSSLGLWQWGRAEQKLALHAAIEQRKSLPPVDSQTLLATRDEAGLLHRPVILRGRWVPRHTIFLDNRQMNGRPGFYVITPMLLEGNAAAILVQRGWAPRNAARREELPPVQTPSGLVELQGRLAPPPAKLYEFEQREAGSIRQNVELSQFRLETGLPLLSLSVRQIGGASEGLLREWPEAGSGAEKNYGYAFQWWALSGLIAILYVWFQFVVPRRAAKRA